MAARQHDVVTRGQLLELGWHRTAIGRAVESGHLHPVHDGVYAVGRPSLDHRGRLLAAAASCKPFGLVSHRFAGGIWEFHEPPVGLPIDVLVPRGKHRCRAGVRIHHTRYLPDTDRAEVDGIPVTSVARTLRDLAAALRFRELRDCFERADRSGLLELDELFEVLNRSNGHRGMRALRRLALLAQHRHRSPGQFSSCACSGSVSARSFRFRC